MYFKNCYHLQVDRKKGFDFLFHLASAWCWDGFQSSLPLSVCASRSISPLVSSTPVSAPQMCTCCAVYLLEQQHLHHQTQDELNNQAAFRLSTGQLHCPLPPFTLNCTHAHSPCFCSSKTHNRIWAVNVNKLNATTRVVFLGFSPPFIKVCAAPHLCSSSCHLAALITP